MEEQYEVDQIVEKRFRKGQVEYLVQWKNYEDPKENTWESAEDLQDAAEMIKKFEKELAMTPSVTTRSRISSTSEKETPRKETR